MLITLILLILPSLVKCAGDGNIRLLEEDIAAALKTCAESDTNLGTVKQKRYADTPRTDDAKETNQYSHERRNVTDMKDQVVINATDLDYDGYGKLTSTPKASVGYLDGGSSNRTRRSEPLFNKPVNDQCLSQCVFANLQVVDSRGIPREAELWNKIQSSVTSQQSRAALKDQISACFQELQSEAEDNGCSYSNKLERCLMLRFSDRKPTDQSNAPQENKS